MKAKQIEVKAQIKELMPAIEHWLNKKADSVFRSGALTDEQKKLESWVLTKQLIALFCEENPYGILAQKNREDLENLKRVL